MTHAGSAVSSGIDTVKTNPIPAALVAVGLGWLIVSSLRGKTKPTYDSRIGASSIDGVDEDGYAYSYDQDVARENVARSRGPRRVIERGRRAVSSVGHDVADRAKDVAHTVADKAEHLVLDANRVAEDATHRVEGVASQAKRRVGTVARDASMKGRRIVRQAGERGRRVERGFERQLRSNPIAFGALAVAVGAAIGLLLPSTEVEDRLIGEQKDRLLDTAKERFEGFAQQAIATVQEKAGEVTSQLKNVEPSSPQQGYQNGLSSQANGISNGVSKHL